MIEQEIIIPKDAIAIAYGGHNNSITAAICLSGDSKTALTYKRLIVNPASKDYGKRQSVSVFRTSMSTVDFVERLLLKNNAEKIWIVQSNMTFHEVWEKEAYKAKITIKVEA